MTIEEKYRRCARPGCGRYFALTHRGDPQIHCGNQCSGIERERLAREVGSRIGVPPFHLERAR
jgi:hypothetical protein